MLFNSIDFLIFFPFVIMLFFALPHRFRWIMLLAASYYFYMCWKVEYILLIILSTVVDYIASRRMATLEDNGQRKRWLYLSLFTNLGILFGFKYFNFVGDNINALFDRFNVFYDVPAFEYLLPVGISFYTFQTLSYTIDVYQRKIEPEKHFGLFALYVSFFPQLVAGPIERPSRLLPQFHKEQVFSYENVTKGLRLMLWGFFLKLVVADRLAPIVDAIYNNPEQYAGLEVALGTVFFCFQIFGDFAGYSSIAIGAAKVMGYDLMENFRRPYFAASIREFWQRWHISLSTWFRDYVYIPLGGNRVVKWRWYYNLFITFLVSGIWHGANWTFVVWGALHGFYLVFAIWMKPYFDKLDASTGMDKRPGVMHLWRVFTTFILAAFAWIFFRANSLSDAFTLIGNLFRPSASDSGLLSSINGVEPMEIILGFSAIALMEMIHFFDETKRFESPLFHTNTGIRWGTMVFLITVILTFGVFTSSEFIYFQF